MKKEWNNLKQVLLVSAIISTFVLVPSGQAGAEVNGPGSFGFNLGFPVGAGDTGDMINDGFGFGLDLGYRPEHSALGFRLDMVYASFDLSSNVLQQINYVNDGYATVWGFDASVVLTPPNANTIRPYLQFGPGFYYQHAEALRVSGGGGVVCDPWFGCWDTGTVQTVQDWTTWRLGWVGGAGINIENSNGGALFLQTQYHLINNAHRDLEFVPISIGYRQSF